MRLWRCVGTAYHGGYPFHHLSKSKPGAVPAYHDCLPPWLYSRAAQEGPFTFCTKWYFLALVGIVANPPDSISPLRLVSPNRMLSTEHCLQWQKWTALDRMDHRYVWSALAQAVSVKWSTGTHQKTVDGGAILLIMRERACRCRCRLGGRSSVMRVDQTFLQRRRLLV